MTCAHTRTRSSIATGRPDARRIFIRYDRNDTVYSVFTRKRMTISPIKSRRVFFARDALVVYASGSLVRSSTCGGYAGIGETARRRTSSALDFDAVSASRTAFRNISRPNSNAKSPPRSRETEQNPRTDYITRSRRHRHDGVRIVRVPTNTRGR